MLNVKRAVMLTVVERESQVDIAITAMLLLSSFMQQRSQLLGLARSAISHRVTPWSI